MGPVASFLLVGHQPFAERMVESVKRVTGYPVIQMSDDLTPPVDGVDEVVRIGFDIPLMPYRLLHLASFPHDEMLILDTDVIVKKPVSDVWERDFDVALTKRTERRTIDTVTGMDIAETMPFNTGVMFSRSEDFWAECAAWLDNQPESLQKWFGDQAAVAHVAHLKRYHTLVLPCKEFNWTPVERNATSDARIWHYKGPRKEWMYDDHRTN